MPQINTVAWQIRQIEEEYASAHAALQGLSAGTARHDFITAKMGRAQEAGERLIEQIGAREALPLIIGAIDASTKDNDNTTRQ